MPSQFSPINRNGCNKLTGVCIHEKLCNFRVKMLATFFNLVCQAAIVVSTVCDAPVLRLLLCCCGRRALTCSRIAAAPRRRRESAWPSPASERFCGDLAPGRRSGCVISKQRKSICAGEVISLIDHDA